MSMPAISFDNVELERLKSILGTMVSRGVNPNTSDYRVISNREDLELIMRIFNKLVE